MSQSSSDSNDHQAFLVGRAFKKHVFVTIEAKRVARLTIVYKLSRVYRRTRKFGFLRVVEDRYISWKCFSILKQVSRNSV